MASCYFERDVMKPKFALLILLAALCFSLDTHSAGRQRVFRSEVNGYSLTIPEGWGQVPNEILEEMHKYALTEAGRAAYDCEAMLAVDWEGSAVEYPTLSIQILTYSDFFPERSLTKNEIAEGLEDILGLSMDDTAPAGEKYMRDDVNSVLSDTDMGSISLDRERMVYRYSVQTEMPIFGQIQGVTVGHMGRYAIVQLVFACLESDWSRFENERSLMFDSFSFDKGMRYQDAPSKLGRGTVRIMVYALVGATVGLIGAMAKWVSGRAPSPERESDDPSE